MIPLFIVDDDDDDKQPVITDEVMVTFVSFLPKLYFIVFSWWYRWQNQRKFESSSRLTTFTGLLTASKFRSKKLFFQEKMMICVILFAIFFSLSDTDLTLVFMKQIVPFLANVTRGNLPPPSLLRHWQVIMKRQTVFIHPHAGRTSWSKGKEKNRRYRPWQEDEDEKDSSLTLCIHFVILSANSQLFPLFFLLSVCHVFMNMNMKHCKSCRIEKNKVKQQWVRLFPLGLPFYHLIVAAVSFSPCSFIVFFSLVFYPTACLFAFLRVVMQSKRSLRELKAKQNQMQEKGNRMGWGSDGMILLHLFLSLVQHISSSSLIN